MAPCEPCAFAGECAEPAAYLIRYDEDFVGGSALACVAHTAEARANDPLEYIASITSLPRPVVTNTPPAFVARSDRRRALPTE